MAKIKIGDIFEISTSDGLAYIHYVFKDPSIGDLVRVLRGKYQHQPDDLENLSSIEEDYVVFFPVTAANKKKLIRHISFSSAENFSMPRYMRTEHNIRREFLGWHIIDTTTWVREFVKTLSEDQIKLSPWGVWNDTLLKERIAANWSLKNWK